MGERQVALITGASGGIGRELAKLFAADGCDVVLVARSRDKLCRLSDELEAAHGITAHVLPADLADSSSPERIFQWLAEHGVQLDYLVNNAGFGASGLFAELPLSLQLDMLQVNIDALVALSHQAVQSMCRRGRGRILNIASVAGFQPGPEMAVYYASKAFVIMFSEAIAEEVKQTGVTVTVHCPGPTSTGFADTADIADSQLFQRKVAPAEQVAAHAYRSMLKGKVIAIEGGMNRLLAFAVRLAPRSWARRIARRMNQKA